MQRIDKTKDWIKKNKLKTGVVTVLAIGLIGGGTTLGIAHHKADELRTEFIQPQKTATRQSDHELQKQLNYNHKVSGLNSNGQSKDGQFLANKYQVNSNKGVTNQGYSQLLAKRNQALKAGLGKTVRGYVKVPSVGIALPIFKSTNQYTLSLGATQYVKGEKMGKGNYVLAGHNMDMPNVLFSNLPNVKRGSKIKLIRSNKTYTYRVTDTKEVNPNQKYVDGKPAKSSVLYQNPKHAMVTLFCCNADGSTRIVVQGALQ
jgi:sortase A